MYMHTYIHTLQNSELNTLRRFLTAGPIKISDMPVRTEGIPGGSLNATLPRRTGKCPFWCGMYLGTRGFSSHLGKANSFRNASENHFFIISPSHGVQTQTQMFAAIFPFVVAKWGSLSRRALSFGKTQWDWWAEYWASKHVHVVIARTCECVTWRGHRDLAHVIQLKIWRWGIILDYQGGTAGITAGFKRRKQVGERLWRCKDRRSEWGGAVSQAMWTTSRSWKRRGNGFSPGASRRSTTPAPILHFWL